MTAAQQSSLQKVVCTRLNMQWKQLEMLGLP
ncbi:hypothetical protein CsSME_00029766 [Camellia sinensis var. sinensis]